MQEEIDDKINTILEKTKKVIEYSKKKKKKNTSNNFRDLLIGHETKFKKNNRYRQKHTQNIKKLSTKSKNTKSQPDFPIVSNWPSDWRFKGWPPGEEDSQERSTNRYSVKLYFLALEEIQGYFMKNYSNE